MTALAITALCVAALSCAIWIYLLTARGGFWRAAERDDVGVNSPLQGVTWPFVAAVIPARDEAAVIGDSMATLLSQDYQGKFELIVVDDHSSDGTAAAARLAAAGAFDRVTVVSAPDLPAGWTGKLWAMHHGIDYAQNLRQPPDYLLLTDADIRYADDVLTDLVRRAVQDDLVLISLLARLHCVSFAERAFVPAFVFFFQMLYPFAWVNRADRPIAGAAGGCMLVKRRALQAAGSIAAIRNELIDDCALAKLLKPRGRIWLGLTRRVESARACPSIREIRPMVVRSAYAQLRFSPWWLAVTAAAMIVAYLAPPALTVRGSGATQWLGAFAWLSMAFALQPTLRFYRVSPLWGLAFPAIAASYLVFTFDSAWQYLRGKGGQWKGRFHRGASTHEIPGHGS